MNPAGDEKLVELSRIRYKVIAGFWYCPFQVGEIIELYDLNKGDGPYFIYTMPESKLWDEQTVIADESALAAHPHLFRKLEWHEDRPLEMMPDYVKYNDKGLLRQLRERRDVAKVEVWVKYETGWFWQLEEGRTIHATHLLPATQQEYNDFIKNTI